MSGNAGTSLDFSKARSKDRALFLGEDDLKNFVATFISSLFVVSACAANNNQEPMTGEVSISEDNSVSTLKTIIPEEGRTYEIASGEYADSLIWVGKIEKYKDEKTIVHISIMGPFVKDGIIVPMVGHAPMTLEAFSKSSVQESSQVFDRNSIFWEGYSVWKGENGGVFIITVSEIIDVAFQPLLNNRAE